jgi:DNA-binding MurR/RpiR family transcriptional regulator
LATYGAPQVAALAAWVLDRPEEVAFKSVRALASSADVNSNTVVRLAQALGFDGYEACREEFRAALLEKTAAYAERAAALQEGDEPTVLGALRDAHVRNAAAMFSPEMDRLGDECADRLLAAPRVFCIGVRSCLSVAHYFSYAGSMAFPNIAPLQMQPSGIVDMLADAGAGDVLVAVTFRHYSVEVVRACAIARERGVAVIAMTDNWSSPIAAGAWRVLPLEMAGPQFLPSLASAFLLVEILLARMAMKSGDAARRIEEFEQRVMRAGGYVADP